MRLTVAQALVRFLSVQFSERDGERRRLVAGCFGIFGHGNVAGVGQALLEAELRGEGELPYYLARNEQGMVHAAAAYARHTNRLSTLACTTSIGPGATNMVTGAALATINRVPVLLLPGDVFATRVADPVLQQLEHPSALDVSVNDCFRPVSRFFDRVSRPEQLPSALLGAMRVLTDPVETGAVTLCLPQDVQAEAFDWPDELFAPRVWTVRRPEPEPRALAEAAALLRTARAPLIVAGGGTIYSEATAALRALAEATGVPVAETQAGKGVDALRPPAGRRSDRRDRDDRRQRAGRRGRRRARRGHPLERLHDRVQHRLRRRRRALRQPQRRARRCVQALGDPARRGRAHRPRRRWARRWPAGRLRRSTRRGHPNWPRLGTRPCPPPTRSATARCPPRAR